MNQNVVPLDETTNVATFGGKAVNLGKMVKSGLPVPNGFAVGLNAFDKQGKLSDEAKRLLKSQQVTNVAHREYNNK